MTTSPAPTAALPLLLPSGRAVSVGDVLTREEAQDLLFVQQGWTPLRPVAQSICHYVVALSESITPAMVVGELFSEQPPLTISEPEAIMLAEQWAETVESRMIAVPVGHQQFTCRDELATPFDQLTAYFFQMGIWLHEARGTERKVEEAEREAGKNPRESA